MDKMFTSHVGFNQTEHDFLLKEARARGLKLCTFIRSHMVTTFRPKDQPQTTDPAGQVKEDAPETSKE